MQEVIQRDQEYEQSATQSDQQLNAFIQILQMEKEVRYKNEKLL